MEREIVLPLSDERAGLATVGGKGAALARLANAGLPVPAGFHVTTAAYREFIALNSLQPVISAGVNSVEASQPAAAEAASRAIREQMAGGRMPEAVIQAVTRAYAALPGEQPAVAVRSSATAEDLPEASFAGQQDTYLNIRGPGALLEAVQKCWASLWTARAIAYRAKNQIDQEAVALGVVVQAMVFADVAGILFTANPINGRRDEILINAAWGLGEAVVSGAVTPDTIIVEKRRGRILRRETAEKQVMTVRRETGTAVAPVPDAQKLAPAINNAQAVELARLGVKIERLFGIPVDVEWALAGGEFAVLQARPITNLPPEWVRPHPKAIYVRGSLAEHTPNPVSPLFGTLGLRAANQATGELTDIMNIDRLEAEYQYRLINGYVFMGFVATPKVMWKITKAGLGVLKKWLGRSRVRWLAARQNLFAVLARWEARDVSTLSVPELLAGVDEVFTQLGRLYTVLQSGTLPISTSSEMVFSRIHRLVRRKGDPEATAFLFGFDTVALQAEKALFDLARWAKDLPALADTLGRLPNAELVAALEANTAPEGVPPEAWAEWSARFESYMQTYGATVFDLDFANPTPAETPATALDVIKMYLRGEGHDPHERQRAAAALREQATQRVLARLRWPLKGWFQKLLRWAQDSGPDREDSLIDLGKANPLVRKMLAEAGRRLAAAGAIERPDDIYWLEETEVVELGSQLEKGEQFPDLRARVTERKATWQAQLKLTPPAILPDNSIWAKMIPWHQTDQAGSTLKGYGASAGSVTAPACVLLGPSDFGKMTPGAVLVAVTTTPAWTPLFAMASAVVTDIGGPLSHSSIVAREYGIPAVMATGMATRRIRDGQLITVDGSAGRVTIPAPVAGDGTGAA